MTDTDTREAQRSKLDEFAQTARTPATEMVLAPTNAQLPAIIGAQPIMGDRRDAVRVLAEIKVLAAAAGDDWFYRFPVRNKRENRTDWIEGPSVKLAMAVMGIVGNIDVDTRVQDFGSTFMIYARAVDLEKGSAITRAFQQNKSAAKIGGADDGRRNDMALQIGQSKAIRNAICALLETYTDYAFEEARNSLVDKIGGNLLQWRDRTVEKLSQRLDIKRVEAVLGRSVKDWLAPDVAKVIAMGKAIEEGMATLDETFPELRAGSETGKHLDDLVEAGKAGEVGEAAASETANPSEAAVDIKEPDPRPLMITQMLQIASSMGMSSQERLEKLELMRDDFSMHHPAHADFINSLGVNAAKVATGVTPAAAARKYLEGIMK